MELPEQLGAMAEIDVTTNDGRRSGFTGGLFQLLTREIMN